MWHISVCSSSPHLPLALCGWWRWCESRQMGLAARQQALILCVCHWPLGSRSPYFPKWRLFSLLSSCISPVFPPSSLFILHPFPPSRHLRCFTTSIFSVNIFPPNFFTVPPISPPPHPLSILLPSAIMASCSRRPSLNVNYTPETTQWKERTQWFLTPKGQRAYVHSAPVGEPSVASEVVEDLQGAAVKQLDK